MDRDREGVSSKGSSVGEEVGKGKMDTSMGNRLALEAFVAFAAKIVSSIPHSTYL